MTDYPYESKAKVDLRRMASQALEASGFNLVEPRRRIDILETKVPGVGPGAALLGDLQADGDDGCLNIYYLLTEGQKATPGWLQGLSRAALENDEVRLYVVSEQKTPRLIQSCRACGAGLIMLSGHLSLDLALHPSADEVKRITAKFDADIASIRGLLEDQRKLEETRIESDVEVIHHQTDGMTGDERSVFMSVTIARRQALRAWVTNMSDKIDDAFNRQDDQALKLTRAEVGEGFRS